MNAITEQVKQIVKNLENGITVTPEEIEGGYYDADYEAGDILSAFDYLQDALDIEYIVNSEGDYLGARVLVAFGGPNIWINTRTSMVEGAWWGDSFSMAYCEDAMGLDDALSELWSCR